MDPEEELEAQVKSLLCANMRRERDGEWMEQHTSFLEAQGEWAVQLGMIDPEVDIPAFSQQLP